MTINKKQNNAFKKGTVTTTSLERKIVPYAFKTNWT